MMLKTDAGSNHLGCTYFDLEEHIIINIVDSIPAKKVNYRI